MKIPEGWKRARLEDVVTFRSGGTPSMSVPDYWEGGDVPWLTAKDLKSFNLNDSQIKVTELGARSGTRIAQPGSVLILVRGMTLFKDVPLGVALKPIAFGQDLKALEPGHELLGRFLAWRLNSSKSKLLQFVDSAGHGTGRLSTERLASLELLLPPCREQEAIVQILDCAENYLSLSAALIDSKASAKRVISEELLTGRRRLKGHSKPWQETPMEAVFDEAKQPNTDSKVNLVITVGKNAIRPQLDHFRRSVASTDLKGYSVIYPGQFVYDPMSAYYGAIGQYELTAPGIVSPVYRVLNARLGYNTAFLRFLFKSDFFVSRIERASTQGNRDGKRRSLSRESFASIRILFPDLEEQAAIAEVIGALDLEIKLLRKQRDMLSEQKKGLMQKLLSGEVRLKEFRS